MSRMDLGLADRVYVVTGASRGLGYAAAAALVADGARVALCGRDESSLRAAADALGGPDVALPVPGDLADPELAGRLVAAAAARYGSVDGALVSVGGPRPGSALTLFDADWRTAFESVFLGPLRVVRAVASAAGPGSSIALVLSTSVRSPIDALALSNALRPALAMTVKGLADELGPGGIRINGLLPGRIDTERMKELEGAGGRGAAARRENERQVPLGRYGTPEEFGRVAAFVLSPAAAYVTGSMVTVDGGLSRAY